MWIPCGFQVHFSYGLGGPKLTLESTRNAWGSVKSSPLAYHGPEPSSIHHCTAHTLFLTNFCTIFDLPSIICKLLYNIESGALHRWWELMHWCLVNGRWWSKTQLSKYCCHNLENLASHLLVELQLQYFLGRQKLLCQWVAAQFFQVPSLSCFLQQWPVFDCFQHGQQYRYLAK